MGLGLARAWQNYSNDQRRHNLEGCPNNNCSHYAALHDDDGCCHDYDITRYNDGTIDSTRCTCGWEIPAHN